MAETTAVPPNQTVWSCTNATQATCNDQPCWASLLLCQGDLPSCQEVLPPAGGCPGGPFKPTLTRLLNGGVIGGQRDPTNVSLSLLPDELFLKVPPPIRTSTASIAFAAVATSSVSSTTAAVPAVITIETSTGPNLALIGGAIGAVCFLSGIFVAYVAVIKRKKSGSSRTGDFDNTDTSSQTNFASKRSETGVRGGDSDGTQDIEMQGKSSTGGVGNSGGGAVGTSGGGGGLQAHLQRRGPDGGLLEPVPRGFKDDFFDDTSSIGGVSVGVSTHISVDPAEFRPFQMDEFIAGGNAAGGQRMAAGLPTSQAIGGARVRPVGRGIDDLRTVVKTHNSRDPQE
ncbi:hypothetical protein BDR26DRAFT_871997 [Obelidium mucronatum]|nr:hypothetical protein BDR26DRAFT_871997 [Obelidium mucronatum]